MITDDADFKTVNNAFPHIGIKLSFLWGSPEGEAYLRSLLVADRPNRKGFPFEVMLALGSLHSLHDAEYPQYRKISKDRWNIN